jgi:hypothetical protein
MVLVATALSVGAASSAVADLRFVGSQYDVGGTFFPGYQFPQASVVPWRSDHSGNVFSRRRQATGRYYGVDGWAVFGTHFDFPNANSLSGNVDYRLVDDPLLPNYEEMPDFIAATQILAHHKAGGDAAALIDDPRTQWAGRWWTFDGVNYPPPDGTNTTGVNPFLKTGYLHGWDEFGHDPVQRAAGRWGFVFGDNPPKRLRIGVMTDGLADRNRAPEEVYLLQVDPNDPFFNNYLQTSSTGSIPYDEIGGETTPGTNRFIDMHFFDIVDPQPGDIIAVAARAYNRPTHVYAGVNAISLDVMPAYGDFNADGNVDAVDYTVWRNTLGQSKPKGTDADHDYSGIVDEADYLIWKENYGSTATGSGGLASFEVPEPASAIMLLSLSLGMSLFRWRVVPRRS